MQAYFQKVSFSNETRLNCRCVQDFLKLSKVILMCRRTEDQWIEGQEVGMTIVLACLSLSFDSCAFEQVNLRSHTHGQE